MTHRDETKRALINKPPIAPNWCALETLGQRSSRAQMGQFWADGSWRAGRRAEPDERRRWLALAQGKRAWCPAVGEEPDRAPTAVASCLADTAALRGGSARRATEGGGGSLRSAWTGDWAGARGLSVCGTPRGMRGRRRRRSAQAPRGSLARRRRAASPGSAGSTSQAS